MKSFHLERTTPALEPQTYRRADFLSKGVCGACEYYGFDIASAKRPANNEATVISNPSDIVAVSHFLRPTEVVQGSAGLCRNYNILTLCLEWDIGLEPELVG